MPAASSTRCSTDSPDAAARLPTTSHGLWRAWPPLRQRRLPGPSRPANSPAASSRTPVAATPIGPAIPRSGPEPACSSAVVAAAAPQIAAPTRSRILGRLRGRSRSRLSENPIRDPPPSRRPTTASSAVVAIADHRAVAAAIHVGDRAPTPSTRSSHDPEKVHGQSPGGRATRIVAATATTATRGRTFPMRRQVSGSMLAAERSTLSANVLQIGSPHSGHRPSSEMPRIS